MLQTNPQNTWQVIESFTQGKHLPELNEDRLVITPHFLGAIDGVSSSAPINGKSGGIIAAESLLQTIATTDAKQPLEHFIERATKDLKTVVGEGIHAPRRAGCTFTLFNVVREEIWQVGDCPCTIDGTPLPGSGPTELEAILSGFRSALWRANLGLGLWQKPENTAQDPAHDVVKNLLNVQSFFANNATDTLGYGVLDGTPIPARFVLCTSVKAAHEIIITSDGYLSVAPTLALAESELNAALKADPLCIEKNIQVKALKPDFHSFDDRTYLRIQRQA